MASSTPENRTFFRKSKADMTPDEIDAVAACKAGIEMMKQENEELYEYFNDLVEKLDSLSELPPDERRKKFKDMEQMGALKFNGVDIRRFGQRTADKPLSPDAFMHRTRRRLKNTAVLIEEFLKRGGFDDGEVLRDQIEALTNDMVDEGNSKAVVGFRDKVTKLRGSDLFSAYQDKKRDFIRSDPEVRTDAEYLASKESAEDAKEMLEERGEDLDELNKQMDEGDISLEEAERRLESLALED